jgi:hypothetical protein
MFVMRLSASGKGFHRVYLNQAQQVFLDGHVRAFEHFGGVPSVDIRYDNLKPVVVRVLRGRDRQETDRFIALRSNGLLRQYLPKGTDLSRWSRDEIEAVAAALNSKPVSHETLNLVNTRPPSSPACSLRTT